MDSRLSLTENKIAIFKHFPMRYFDLKPSRLPLYGNEHCLDGKTSKKKMDFKVVTTILTYLLNNW